MSNKKQSQHHHQMRVIHKKKDTELRWFTSESFIIIFHFFLPPTLIYSGWKIQLKLFAFFKLRSIDKLHIKLIFIFIIIIITKTKQHQILN